MNMFSSFATFPSMTEVFNSATHVFNRLSSNQAYTQPSAAASTRKVRVAAIGKAPKVSTIKHKSKPYDRTGPRSVSRRAASAISSVGATVARHISNSGSRVVSYVHQPWHMGVAGSQVRIDAIVDEDQSTVNYNCYDDFNTPVIPSLPLTPTDTSVQTEILNTRDSRLIRGHPCKTHATLSTSSARVAAITQPADPTLIAGASADVFIRIPGHLQKPDVGPMTHLRLDEELIPAYYVRYHLDPHLTKILSVGAMYRPVAYAESPLTPAMHLNGEGLAHSMAFGIPAILRGDDVDGKLAEFVSGYEPDLLLAVQRPAGTEYRFDLRPIKHIVYSARCALFPSLPSHPLSMHFVHPDHTAKESDGEKAWDDKVGQDDDDASLFDNEGTETPRPPSAMSSVSACTDSSALTALSKSNSISAASDAASFDSGAYIHLPIVAIELPVPESFDMCHTKLHSPNTTWEPILLGLRHIDALNPTLAVAALGKLSTRELSRRLNRVHGVWANMCALGVDDDRMWSQLNRAYKMLLDALRRRAFSAALAG